MSRSIFVLAWVVSSVFFSDLALAQPADRTRQALELGYQADQLYAKGRWNEAYELFERAEAEAHSPVFVLYMARCRKNAGRLLEARALYERVASESLPARAPKPFQDAVADARSELEDVRAKIPALRVTLKPMPSTEATLRIDGRRSALGGTQEVDPGAHQIEVRSGDRVVEKRVRLDESSGVVTLEMTLPDPPRPAPPEPAPVAETSTIPAWIALSVGVLGLGVGAVTGSMAKTKADDVKSRCEGTHCLKQDADELDQARSLATVSTVAFLVGGVGIATAGVLFVVQPGGEPSAQGRSPTWVAVSGRF